ncbi:aspartate kinase [Vibrio hippocampi]|uniref:Aspartokinase n=1 Tax=Vibrio hippocampi TaxID=654686 RepID=A0ABM8ZF08_9VIBR|nr:aspartate kinase [Vibrio hippocampi]CAH0524605.1 Uridylate kinase [Vibrio hippocampi]
MKRPLIVQKFGGTSVGSVERIENVAEHVIRAKYSGKQVVVVVSAMSGETNRLMALAKQVDKVPNARELDVLLSAGEQVSMALLAMTLDRMGHKAVSLTGAQAGIKTNRIHNDATISDIDTQAIEHYLQQDQIVIVAGFQGINDLGDITTLGRGGSDTTAVTLAGALKAEECQIFTDVDGVYSCDPRVVSNAKRIAQIDYPTMEEMARKGAKVLHLPCVQYARNNRVPVRVVSSFTEGSGTLVCGESVCTGLTGIAIQKDLVAIGVAAAQVESVDKQCKMLGIESYWLTQANQNELLIKAEHSDKLKLVIEDKITQEQQVGLLTLVGTKAREQVSHYQQLLKFSDISVLHFFEDEHSISLVLTPSTIDRAANLLHDGHIINDGALSREEKQVYLG